MTSTNARPLRALIVVRLSNLTEETTSPERQLAVCQRVCAERGWPVVGVAEDLDVSASKTSPFDRPSLRPWLDRPGDYDVIVFWRVDRLVRRVVHLAKMIEWSDKHEVNLVSATEAYFDLSTTIGRALAVMVGVFAEMESDAISERTTQTFEHNTRAGKYRGGFPPFGYRPEKVDEDWRYALDPTTAELAGEIAGRLIDGELPHRICIDLNERGVPTPQDHFRASQGKPTTGAVWRTANLVREMACPTLLGQTVARAVTGTKAGKKVYGPRAVVRGDDGAPLVRADAVLDQRTFDRVQEALAARAGTRGPYRKSEALLLRVVYCGCGQPMYLNKGRTALYYRCASASLGTSCGTPAVRQDDADTLVTQHVLDDFGTVQRMAKEYDPGSDVAAELADVLAELADVAGLIGTGPFRSGPPRERLEARAEALDDRRAALEAVPSRPSGYRLVPTGQTFGEYWATLTDQDRSVFLRDNGVRLTWRPEPGTTFHLHYGDLPALAEAAKGGPAVPSEFPPWVARDLPK